MKEKKYFATFEVELYACNDKEVLAAAYALKRAMAKYGAEDPIISKVEQPMGGIETRKVDLSLLGEKEIEYVEDSKDIDDAIDELHELLRFELKNDILEYYTSQSAREHLLKLIGDTYREQIDGLLPNTIAFDYTLDICSFKGCGFECIIDLKEDLSGCDIQINVSHDETNIELEFYPSYSKLLKQWCDDIIRSVEVIEEIKKVRSEL